MRFSSLSEIRIVYMGTPEISAYCLKQMIEAGCQIVGVVTNPDSPLGRKHVLTPSPVKQVAFENGLKVFTPEKIRLDHAFLKELNPDVIVTFSYGQIVPQEVLDTPKIGAINLHGSLLPEYRGAAPMQRAIIEGKKETGVSLMKMVLAMDAGEVYDVEKFAIEDNDNYSSVYQKMAEAGSHLILRDLLAYSNGELKGVPQEESKVTYAKKILPEDEHLSLKGNCSSLLNWIRGLSNIPGGYLMLGEEKMKIFAAKMYSENTNHTLGEITKADKALVFQAKDGEIEILSLQLPGKKVMEAKSFLNGNKNLLGKVLS